MTAKPVVVSDVPPSAERIASDTTELGLAVPSAWTDRLLHAVLDSPLDLGRDAVVDHLLDAVSLLFPDHAVGVCLVGEPRRVFLRAPAGSTDGPPDPTRLFSRIKHERIVPIDAAGSSLHVAQDDESQIEVSGVEMRFFDRVAHAIGSLLQKADVFMRARAQSDELRRLQQQVIQSEKLASLGQIAAGVVHELNNPLTSIVVYSDYLRKKAANAPSPDAEDVERLRRIGEAAERILRFSRDLVDYARPSSGVPGTVQIHDVIEQALVFCEHVLGKTGVTVERSYTTGARPVLGIGGELTQVFVNLFTNACHAMPDTGGRLVVATSVEGDFVRVDVADNGHGIGEDVRQKIFEPFFTTKVEGMGTGLGLSIVKNIVERHRGAVRAENEPGGGARFVVLLPQAAR